MPQHCIYLDIQLKYASINTDDNVLFHDGCYANLTEIPNRIYWENLEAHPGRKMHTKFEFQEFSNFRKQIYMYVQEVYKSCDSSVVSSSNTD